MYDIKVSPNVLSLTDTALTLIVVFLVTLPAMFWSGINIDTAGARAGEGETEGSAEVLIVNVSRRTLYINGKPTALFRLRKRLSDELFRRRTKEVIIVPDGDVSLKRLVKVFDVIRMAGAGKLILLKDDD